MELWELMARESIRDLIARYNANADTGRFDDLMKLFAPDAEMEANGGWHRGHPEIRAMFAKATQSFSTEVKNLTHVRHSTTTLQIDLIDQQHAKSRCYFSVILDHGLDHWGRYIDEFKVVNGEWKFAKRRVLIDKLTTPLGRE